jgi:hypothetical protein
MDQHSLPLGNEWITALAMRLVEENVMDMSYAIQMISCSKGSKRLSKVSASKLGKREGTGMDRTKFRDELKSVLMQYAENAAEYRAEMGGENVEQAKAKARRGVEKDLENMYKEIAKEEVREPFPWLDLHSKDAAGGVVGAQEKPTPIGGIRFVDGMDGDTHTRVVHTYS